VFVYLKLEINVIPASYRSICPLVDNCFYAECPYFIANKPLKLQGASEWSIILYTVSEGTIAAKYFNITCDGKYLHFCITFLQHLNHWKDARPSITTTIMFAIWPGAHSYTWWDTGAAGDWTCNDLEHCNVKKAYIESGTAFFQLCNCLKRAQMAHTDNSLANSTAAEVLEIDGGDEEEFLVQGPRDADEFDKQIDSTSKVQEHLSTTVLTKWVKA
jgi:hypothetical protein